MAYIPKGKPPATYRPRATKGTEASPGSTKAVLLAAQAHLETEAVGNGRASFLNMVTQAVQGDQGTLSPVVRWLHRSCVEPVALRLDNFLHLPYASKFVAHRWVEALGTEVAAYIAVKVVLDSIFGQRRQVVTTAKSIAQAFQDEMRYRKFQELEPVLWQWKLRQFKENLTTSYIHMKRSLDAVISQRELDVQEWTFNSDEEKVHVGSLMLHFIAKATKVITFEESYLCGNKTKPKHIEATEETKDWVKQMHLRAAELCPEYPPCVVPPVDWTTPYDGGYHFCLTRRFSLVRQANSKNTEEQLKRLESAYMPEVYEGINALQRTPWKVNLSVLEVMSRLAERGIAIPNVLPGIETIPEPPKPEDIDTNEEARRLWRKKKGEVINENHRRTSKAIISIRCLSIAKKMRDYREFYFPHFLDFRGRCYPIPPYLNPQGNDAAKGLLLFSRSRPLGAYGCKWLVLHGAGCLADDPFTGDNIDKQPLAQRIQWIEDHKEQISDVAFDPLGITWWQLADKPWQFLAFCFEYVRVQEWIDKGDAIEDFESCLPVSIDGSCNGIQHWAALLRDPVAGKAVNLVPADKPQDIYAEVAEVVKRRVAEDAAGGGQYARLAREWLHSGLISRSLCKRPVMTVPYSVTMFGIKEQIQSYLIGDADKAATVKLMDKDKATGAFVPSMFFNQHSNYIGSVIYDSLGESIVAAKEGMEYLKHAVALVHLDRPVEWYTPSGFIARQGYWRMHSKRIETQIAGRMDLTLQKPGNRLDSREQTSGIAPNVVHSLDAAVMMLTIKKAVAAGIVDLAMVHDSYGCHAGLMEQLRDITRKTFAEMYSWDVFGFIAGQLAGQIKPTNNKAERPLPIQGSLDVSEVQKSEYFFV